MIPWIIGAAAFLLILVTISVLYNRLVSARNQVQEAFSTIDVHLQKRFHLIPNLVAVVKGYSRHESETLQQLTEMRSQAADVRETAQRDRNVTQTLQQFRVHVEQYPDLKADGVFAQLMDELSLVEDDLLFARRFYNGTVRECNNTVESFPSNLIAALFGFRVQPFYEIEDPERVVPTVEL